MRTLLLALALTTTPAFAQANPQIDYPAFQALTASVAPTRATRLIAFDAFKAEAAKPGTLLLDARSKDAFARGHIKGAVNLPLTDFTAESLAAVIGADPSRPILIYCNNNFRNNAAPVPMKAAPLALNIQTFINLVGYGYPNVRELADVVDFGDPKVEWVTG
ncbi:rhodanese-like domain-containing protein [Sphingopyxis sp.]|uniref:rhodanese-like domain-containing protein n=1 Tax=Sphingopyxis sp. TaxID=1908224 RepID=UPI002B483C1E|nr:rhodanese-like domain-containing protein [Sphingopyxis sp.]HJS11229.1 rhodanese-like domain-containing protein [Sphingopyxis sp.]